MVTGATGYVAGWLVKKLLDEGLTVHAAVRDPDNKNKTAHLLEVADKSTGDIKFFKSDLLIDGSYAEAMKGCELIYHTASPFTSSVENPKEDLIEPAQSGTRNVLEQANKTESVKRVVVTSSCAAIYGDNIDLEQTTNGVFTEEIWNTTSSIKHQPYSYSKLLAEKEAWKINEQQSRWDLIVINPSLVLGPALNPHTNTSESFSILIQMTDGTFKSGVPDIGMGVVDVRDLGDIHYNAGFTPESHGRHIASGHNSGLLEIAKIIKSRFGDAYKISDKALPKWLLMIVGPMVNKTLTRKYIHRNVNQPFKADNTKSIQSLGASYRPLEETLTDSVQQLIDIDLK